MSYGSAALKIAAPFIAITIAGASLVGIFRAVNKFVEEAEPAAPAASASCVHEPSKEYPNLATWDCTKK
jgi:hypothetical protein